MARRRASSAESPIRREENYGFGGDSGAAGESAYGLAEAVLVGDLLRLRLP
jgi:hypothetical protein